jgi:hypothetical protein
MTLITKQTAIQLTIKYVHIKTYSNSLGIELALVKYANWTKKILLKIYRSKIIARYGNSNCKKFLSEFILFPPDIQDSPCLHQHYYPVHLIPPK